MNNGTSAWFVADNGMHSGPFGLDHISTMIANGMVDGHTLVWAEQLKEWTALQETDLNFLLQMNTKTKTVQTTPVSMMKPTHVPLDESAANDQNKIEGLGGWLTVVGLMIIIAPLKIAAEIPVYEAIFSNGTWDALTSSASSKFNPQFKNILLGEMAMNAGLFCMYIYINTLFFRKKSSFPSWFILVSALNLTFSFVVSQTLDRIIPGEYGMNSELTAVSIHFLASSLYMLSSKRVQTTFVR